MSHVSRYLALVLAVTSQLSCSKVPLSNEPAASSSRAKLSTATGSMVNGRSQHTLTVLSDGRVLAVGGSSDPAVELTAEIYDPTTGGWAATGSLTVGRAGHHAVRLPSGHVLISGGTPASGAATDPIPDELFDPAAGTFTLSGTSEAQHGLVVLLADGRVLESSGGAGASRIFDESTGLYVAAASSVTSHTTGMGVLLSDGRVMAAGGLDSGAATTEADLYDPTSDTWSATEALAAAVAPASGLRLADGRVLLVGGSSTALYDPATGTWTAGTLPATLGSPLLGLATDGRVYAMGGSTVLVIDPAALAAAVTGPLTTDRTDGALADLGGGQFLLAGGTGGSSSVEIYGQCTATTTCVSSGAVCGALTDDCGGPLDCGVCPGGSLCTANQCVCTPSTCAQQSLVCGPAADGCGSTLDCGTCGAGLVCTGAACVDPTAASYSQASHAPTCAWVAPYCSSGTLLNGRGALTPTGAEAHAPNTLDGSCDGLAGTYQQDESLESLKVSTLDGSPLNAGKTVRVDAALWAGASYSTDQLVLAYSSGGAWTPLATLVPTQSGPSTLTATFVLPTLPADGLRYVRGTFDSSQSTGDVCSATSYRDVDDLAFAVAHDADTTAPTTSITSPAAGAALGATATVTAAAADDFAVDSVDFYMDTTLLGSSSVAPYSYLWATSNYAVGAHTLTSKAHDTSNHTTVSAPVSITLTDTRAPFATFSTPNNNALLTGTSNLSVAVSDNVGVTSVEYYASGALVGTSTSGPFFIYGWNTVPVANGNYSLTARAYDAAGNVGVATARAVIVNNDHTAPSVALTSPANNATLSGTVTLTTSSSDNVGVTQVSYYAGTTFIGTSLANTTTHSVTWASYTFPNGSVSLTAVAYDAAGNVATSAARTVTLNNDKTPPTVAFTSPTNGATVGASVSMTVTAADNVGVTQVAFYEGSTLLGYSSQLNSPFTFLWNAGSATGGGHTIRATASDASGNSASTTVYVNLDNTAPVVSVTSPNYNATVSGTVTLSATTTDNSSGVASVSYYAGSTLIGTSTASPSYSFSWDTTPLANGSQSLTARATDAVGNVGTSTALPVTLNNDKTPPTVSFSSPGSGALVGGPSVTLAAYANDNVGVTQVKFFDGATLLGTVTPGASPFSYVWNTTGATSGTHTLFATAYDAAGNSASASVQVTVDGTPPTVAVTSPANGATVSSYVTLTATASDAHNVSSVYFYDGATGIGQGGVSGSTYTFTWFSTNAANGMHTLTAVAVDTLGNTATSAPVSVTVNNDKTPPTVSLTSPADGATLSGTINLTVSASDNVGVTQVAYYVGATLLCNSYAPTYSCGWVSSTSPNGSQTLTARAYDAAGNSTTSAPVTITLSNDKTPPTVALLSPPAGSTLTATVSLTASATDDVGMSRVQYYVDGALIGVGNDPTSNFALTWTPNAVSAGSHTLSATAYDTSGNTASTSEAVVQPADTTPPSVALTSPADGAPLTGTTTLTATASDNRLVSSVAYYDGATLLGSSTTNPYSFSWSTGTAANGAHTLTAKATDAAGNVGTSAPVSVTLSNDKTPPTLSMTSPSNNSTVGGTVNVTVSASDNVGVSIVSYYFGSTYLGSSSVAPYTYAWNTVNSPVGVNNLTAIAYDAAGNSTATGVSVTVSRDTVAPTVSITNPLNGYTLSGVLSLTISASDNVAVTSVSYYLDGATLLATSTTSPLLCLVEQRPGHQRQPHPHRQGARRGGQRGDEHHLGPVQQRQDPAHGRLQLPIQRRHRQQLDPFQRVVQRQRGRDLGELLPGRDHAPRDQHRGSLLALVELHGGDQRQPHVHGQGLRRGDQQHHQRAADADAQQRQDAAHGGADEPQRGLHGGGAALAHGHGERQRGRLAGGLLRRRHAAGLRLGVDGRVCIQLEHHAGHGGQPHADGEGNGRGGQQHHQRARHLHGAGRHDRADHRHHQPDQRIFPDRAGLHDGLRQRQLDHRLDQLLPGRQQHAPHHHLLRALRGHLELQRLCQRRAHADGEGDRRGGQRGHQRAHLHHAQQRQDAAHGIPHQPGERLDRVGDHRPHGLGCRQRGRDLGDVLREQRLHRHRHDRALQLERQYGPVHERPAHLHGVRLRRGGQQHRQRAGHRHGEQCGRGRRQRRVRRHPQGARLRLAHLRLRLGHPALRPRRQRDQHSQHHRRHLRRRHLGHLPLGRVTGLTRGSDARWLHDGGRQDRANHGDGVGLLGLLERPPRPFLRAERQ
jgi:hypothetical protein